MAFGNHPKTDRDDLEAPVFSARLLPYRSLSQNGFIALMVLIGSSCLASGMMFLAIGAWPVVGFLGLDVFLVWAAFKLNYRAARCFEEIAVWPHDLRIRQISPAGNISEHSFNPSWTRFFVDRHDEIGIVTMGLRGEGRELVFGAFLNPADRESFAAAFSQALASVKGN
jgi:uncharacterized membrane protein